MSWKYELSFVLSRWSDKLKSLSLKLFKEWCYENNNKESGNDFQGV